MSIKTAQKKKTGRTGTVSTENVKNKELVTDSWKTTAKLLSLAGYNFDFFENSTKKAASEGGKVQKSKGENTSFEIDKYFQSQIAKWETLKQGGYVKVGKIGENHPLHKIGMPTGVLRYDVAKLKKNMVDHSDYLTVDLLKAIPDIIEHPVAISEYSQDNTVSVFGNIFIGKSPMMVGVTISKDNAGNDISKVRTFNARKDVGKLITDKTVLYLNENKKVTRDWFLAIGIQVPLGETKFGFIRSISQSNTKINSKVQNSSGEGLFDGINGYYDWETNTIGINVAAEGEGAISGILGRTLSHEIVHSIQRWNPDGYEELRSFVTEKLGDSFAGMVQRKMKSLDLDYSDAVDEVVADACEMMLKDSKALSDFAKKHRNVFEKIVDCVMDFIEKIRSAISSLYKEDGALHDEAVLMGEYADELQEIFDRVLFETLEISSSTVDRSVQSSANKKAATDGGKVQYSRRLTNEDINDYLNAGSRKNISKLEAFEKGTKIILISEEEISSFINRAIEGGRELNTVAYGRVNDYLANDVSDYSGDTIDIRDSYLELVPSDIYHAYREHKKAKQPGDIDLSIKDFENIPSYLDHYDDLVYAIKYKSGSTKICVSKKTTSGRVLLIEVVSKSRKSIFFKNMIGVSEEKYITDYKNVYKKRNSTNTRGSDSSNNSLRDATASTNSISDTSEKSKGKVQKSAAEPPAYAMMPEFGTDLNTEYGHSKAGYTASNGAKLFTKYSIDTVSFASFFILKNAPLFDIIIIIYNTCYSFRRSA